MRCGACLSRVGEDGWFRHARRDGFRLNLRTVSLAGPYGARRNRRAETDIIDTAVETRTALEVRAT